MDKSIVEPSKISPDELALTIQRSCPKIHPKLKVGKQEQAKGLEQLKTVVDGCEGFEVFLEALALVNDVRYHTIQFIILL